MQTLSGPRSNGLGPRSRRVAVFAVLLFALAGLLSGFTVGAFVRPKTGGTVNNQGGNGTTPIVQQTRTETPVSGPQPVHFSFPIIDHVESPGIANGTTYTLTAHLKKVLGKDGQPIHADNLTCKLWLIAHIPGDQKISIPPDILKNVSSISNSFAAQGADENGNPLPSVSYPEIQPSLVFNDSTPQTHACRTDGEATWRYQISPQATPGEYTVVVLYDWSGKHYNWSWTDFKIKQANPN